MSDMGFTPELVAGGNILPFRFVKLDTAAPFQGISGNTTNALAATDTPVGVADGSIYQAYPLNSNGYHAISGTPISLQPTNTVQVEAGAAISTAGTFLMSDSVGRAVPLATTAAAGGLNVSCYIALETASAAGEIIRAYKFGTRFIIS